MKNTFAISSMSRQLGRVCDQIDHLAYDAQETSGKPNELCGLYRDMLLDELEHVQVLTLKLTELVSQAVAEDTGNADEAGGSVFSEGDLTAEKTGSEDGPDEAQEPEQKPAE